MNGVNILIVEDDPVVALALEMLIQRTGCHIMAIVEGFDEAQQLICSTTPDMVFINTESKGNDKGELLIRQLRLRYIPIVLIPDFKTSGDRQKLRSYMMHTLGALFGNMVPTDNREDCILKDCIFFKKGNDLHKVPFKDIRYIKSEGNYCEFHTDAEKFVHRTTFASLTGILPLKHFLRIHRSYIVHLQYIKKISLSNNVLIAGCSSVPIGKAYKDALVDCLQRIVQ